jgi:hypothetical protein
VSRLWADVQVLMGSWEEWKFFLERSITFSSDALHVIAGVLVQLAAALVMRRSMSNWAPWMVVLVLVGLNEFTDLSVDYWPHRGMQLGETAKDVMLTMFLPTVLLFAARNRRVFAVSR